jgi:hypothetical protein
MGQFKPMVKMYTDEPSVSLKLKKGGSVKHKAMHHEGHGHKAMHEVDTGLHGAHHAFEAEHGKAPKKPSAAARRKAMNPNFYKKGGHVEHKLDGGVMPVRPMAPTAVTAMAPAARAARAAMVRRALTGMKKGGSADHALIKKLEKELHHHESMPASKAHKADGGAIDKAETRTTIEKGAKKFERTHMIDGQHHDKVHGTGDVKEGKPGGYKHGGKVHHVSGHPEGSHEHHKAMARHHAKLHKEGGSAHHAKMHEHHKHQAKMCKGGTMHKATGGAIPANTNKSVNKGKIEMGGTIEGNEGPYLETEMHEATPDRAHGTGGVSMSNAGGFRRGGKAHKMHHKASGGAIDAKLTRTTVEGGDWENRPADTAKAGKSHTKTGEVKESNAGGYKHGGHASKKAYATGGNVVDDGKAVKMPRRIVHAPVANSLQSGTYKRGGKVHKADGGPLIDSNEGYRNWERGVREENEADRRAFSPLNIAKKLYQAPGKLIDMMRSPAKEAPKAVTETEKSTTVVPRKRGGKA